MLLAPAALAAVLAARLVAVPGWVLGAAPWCWILPLAGQVVMGAVLKYHERRVERGVARKGAE